MLQSNPAAGDRHLYEYVQWQRKEKGVKKQPGHTWIKEVHMFVVDTEGHPQMIEICAELLRFSGPDTKSVLHDVEEERKGVAFVLP